jgi:hypothetical protein
MKRTGGTSSSKKSQYIAYLKTHKYFLLGIRDCLVLSDVSGKFLVLLVLLEEWAVPFHFLDKYYVTIVNFDIQLSPIFKMTHT